MTPRSPLLWLVLGLIAPTASGCWSHVDVLPWMDIPPYRDPPPGFSSTYHRALYGPRPTPPNPADISRRAAPATPGGDELRLLRHAADAPDAPRDTAADPDDEPARPRRLPSFDFLMRPAKPIRF